MDIALGIFLFFIAVVGLILTGIGIKDGEPGTFLVGACVALCGVTFSFTTFVKSDDSFPAKMTQHRVGDIVIVKAGKLSLHVHCPEMVQKQPSPRTKSEKSEEEQYEAWLKEHLQ